MTRYSVQPRDQIFETVMALRLLLKIWVKIPVKT